MQEQNAITKRKVKQILISSAALLSVIASVSGLVSHLVAAPNETNHFLQYVVDLISIFLSWNLYNRKRYAQLFYIFILGTDLFLYAIFIRNHDIDQYYLGTIDIIYLIVDVYVLAILLIFWRSFNRHTAKLTASGALVPLLIAVFDAGFIFFSKWDFDAVLMTLGGDDLSQSGIAMCAVFWISIVATTFLIFRPGLVATTRSKSLRAYARRLVLSFGQNSTSYLALENDKILYFGEDVEGVIQYGVVNGVAVVLGDPICAPEDFVSFLVEWRDYCLQNEYLCVFIGASEEFLEIYDRFGYRHVKCGEEGRFDLENMSLSGKKKAKMRMNINHANAAGLQTFEYKPCDGRDDEIEQGIRAVSQSWLEGKKSGQLGFSVGDVGLEDPLDRRYFYCKDESGRIVAFDVFLPFLSGDGYIADVTRRLREAPSGVTEKLFYDAMTVFKEEGCHWGSLGLAPLANVLGEDEKDSWTSKILNVLYERGNTFYGFKDLYKTKGRYGPDIWVPGYFVYSGTIFTPRMAMSLVRIQNPGGIFDFIASILHKPKMTKPVSTDAHNVATKPEATATQNAATVPDANTPPEVATTQNAATTSEVDAIQEGDAVPKVDVAPEIATVPVAERNASVK